MYACTEYFERAERTKEVFNTTKAAGNKLGGIQGAVDSYATLWHLCSQCLLVLVQQLASVTVFGGALR